MIVASKIVPSYFVNALDRKIIVAEKVNALLSRQKPRDFFDLYFILRKEELRPFLSLKLEQRKKIISILESLDKSTLAKELKSFLPNSFWQIIKDLPFALKRELI